MTEAADVLPLPSLAAKRNKQGGRFSQDSRLGAHSKTSHCTCTVRCDCCRSLTLPPAKWAAC